jgi:hypothetical protein
MERLLYFLVFKGVCCEAKERRNKEPGNSEWPFNVILPLAFSCHVYCRPKLRDTRRALLRAAIVSSRTICNGALRRFCQLPGFIRLLVHARSCVPDGHAIHS